EVAESALGELGGSPRGAAAGPAHEHDRTLAIPRVGRVEQAAERHELRTGHVAELAAELRRLAHVDQGDLVAVSLDVARIDVSKWLVGRLGDRRVQVAAAIRVRWR